MPTKDEIKEFSFMIEKLDFLERDLNGFKDEFARWVKEF